MLALWAHATLLLQLATCAPQKPQTRIFHRPPAAERLTKAETIAKLEGLSGRSHVEASKARRLADEFVQPQSHSSWLFDKTDPVQQVNLAPGGPGEAMVTWVTKERGLSSAVEYAAEDGNFKMMANGDAKVYVTQICLSNPDNDQQPVIGPPNQGFNFTELTNLLNTSSFLPSTSSSYKYVPPGTNPWKVVAEHDHCVSYVNPHAFRSSPYIHTAVLTGLKGRTKYTFKPESSTRSFTFITPPDPGETLRAPFRIGLWGDIGITNVSVSVMDAMRSWQLDLLLTAGDLSYADGWPETWDVYGTLMEPLHSSVYQLAVPGNHEVNMNNGVDFAHRYPQPFQQSDSGSPFMFNYETGPVHIIGVPGSYAPTDHESPQWNFVAEKLSQVDRKRTPWVVVMFHTPWYNSNGKHYQQGLKHQWDMEELLYSYGVDVVVNGHVHDYERSFPVYNYTLDDCGITHIVAGDGGNIEGPAVKNGGWKQPQPAWSAFREAAFGAGMFTFLNATHAEWEWKRVACVRRNPMAKSRSGHSYSFDGTRQSLGRTSPTSEFFWDGIEGPADGPECATDSDTSEQRYAASDKVTIVRDVQQCPNKAMGPGGPQRRKQTSTSTVSYRLTRKGYRLAAGVCSVVWVALLGFACAFSSLSLQRRSCYLTRTSRVQPQFEALLANEALASRRISL